MPRGTVSTTQSATANEYDAVWEDDMRCNGINMPDIIYDQPQPLDKAWLQTRIRQRRDSMSLTQPSAEAEWLKVKHELRLVAHKSSVRQIIEPKLLSGGCCSVCPHIHQAANVYISNDVQLVPKLPRFSKSDSVDGAPPGSFGLPILDVLRSVI
jgi:hypothetical protein